MEKNDEYKIVNIPFFKKIWISITKFERYPEMATEGVKKALSYFTKLMIIFSIIISIAIMHNFNNVIKKGVEYLDKNISEINYKDGILEINPVDKDNINIITDIGAVIIDTNTIKEDKQKEYDEKLKSSDLGIMWLDDKAVIYSNGIVEEEIHYKSIFQKLEISEFNKTDLIEYINNNKTIYISYFLLMFINTFIVYFITILLDILMLSIIGLVTSYMAKIKIRYRAIFNMSVYALTISIILKLIYVLIEMFSDFTIKYFDFMYTAIGYICLVASIFMIKSDVIKQQIELMRLREEKKLKKEEQQEKDEEEKEKENKEEKKENNKDENDEQELPDSETENQGSNA